MSIISTLPDQSNNEYFISFDERTGRIYRISKRKPSLSDHSILKINKDESVVLKQILNDYLSIDNAFIGYNGETKSFELHKRARTIYLPQAQKTYIDIKEEDNPDVSMVYYTENRLLDIEINYKAVKSFIKRQTRNFEFVRGVAFTFRVMDDDKILKTFTVSPKKFLETLQTTVDLSDIEVEDTSKISFQTKRVFQTYSIVFEKFKIMKKEFQKLCPVERSTDKKERYDIRINKTQKRNVLSISCSLDRTLLNQIFQGLDFYFTGKDINDFYGMISIPIEQLWKRKRFIEKIDFEIEDKLIWVNNKLVKVNFSEGVVRI